ncbi:unnamed protein product [Scytosiphon promiscuus]
MFDLLASKLEEAQAYADGLAVNLDVINMDRLLEEQEREERSKDESLRLLRTSGDATDAASPRTRSGVNAAMQVASEGKEDDRRLLADIEVPQLRKDEEQLELQKRSRLSSPSCGASEGSLSFSDRFASLEDGGHNFEDDFDPILASIRKPPQQQQSGSTQGSVAAAAAARQSTSPRDSGATVPPLGGTKDGNESAADRPSASSSFAVGFLSMLPGDMRAKAGEVMAQSSARISESASAFRSALDARGAVPSGIDRSKRRQSDPVHRGVNVGDAELGEGRGGKAGGRRAVGGDGEEDEVRMLNVNELLSEEERQQLSSFSAGAGGAGRFCGWGRIRKYAPVFVGIALLGLLYLWRWTTLLVSDNTNGVASLGSER